MTNEEKDRLQYMIDVMQAKRIKGYEDYYITTNGDVYSKRKKETYIKLKPGIYKGYQYVYLVNDAGPKKMLIHRLVAEAFITNANKLPYIDHINTNRSDNRVENLRWCTAKQNCNNVLTTLHQRQSSGTKELRNIRKYSLTGELLGTYLSPQRGAISEGHKGNTCVIRCCNGERCSAYGKIWRWEGDAFDKYPLPIHPYRHLIKRSGIGQYDIYNNLIGIYKSIAEAANKTGIKTQNISACCLGKYRCKSAGGFIWKYIEK